MPDTARARAAPASTYRLQLTARFGFAEAGELADYLAALGVTHVYLSPVLQAAPGSTHGYDVVDHSRISADLGGEAAFRAMAARFRSRGLGLVLDIVPNHMAIPAPERLNRQLWSVLGEGPASPYAHWFDVDWQAQRGRLLLPILGGPLEDCAGDLRVGAEGDEPVLRYFDHVLPLRAGTAGLPPRELLDAQHYRLAHWRDAATELNWRRFFDITSLIAIRAEDPDVFGATHRLPLSLMAEGLVDGLRVDHPDGLADPRGYFRRLAEATGGAWVVAEKILAVDERLPASWPCAGTTGYDILRLVDGLFVDPAGAGPLTDAYIGFGGTGQCFAPVEETAKREIAQHTFPAELSRLVRVLVHAAEPALDGFSPADMHAVLVEMLASFGTYRAYVTPGEPPPETSAAVVEGAVADASRRLPDQLRAAAAAIGEAVLGRGSGGAGVAGPGRRAAREELIVRFQQTTGPVLAKGVEDTAFYRWPRLIALNEVGGDPGRFGVSAVEFHAAAWRLASDWPATLTTLSTHDTKRQEDVRARLAVLAESPAEWAREVTRWHEAAVRLNPEDARAAGPETEYLMWQTLAGAWPVSAGRLREYLTKAMREAKTRTSWTDPDEAYESAVLGFAGTVLDDPELTAGIAAFAGRAAADARVNALGAKLVQLTMPGVADVYQGCELAGLSLVDPDNRRPVDFVRRRQLLAALDAAASRAPGPESLDEEKLLVTSRALRLRRDHPDWFAGSYRPLVADGPAARHAVAFQRGGHAVTVVTRLPAGLRRRGGWGGTVLPLPEGDWMDILNGAGYSGTRPLLSSLTRKLPVALLVPRHR